MTYEVRAGTSSCDRSDRASRQATAMGAVGATAAAMSRRLAGMWVKTIVRTRPMRAAIRGASSAELAVSSPLQKKIVPAVPVDRSKGRESHSTMIEWAGKPPPDEARVENGALRGTTAFGGGRTG